MIREQMILLKVQYDDITVESPAQWDGPSLLGENVQILEVDGQKVRENNGNLVRD